MFHYYHQVPVLLCCCDAVHCVTLCTVCVVLGIAGGPVMLGIAKTSAVEGQLVTVAIAGAIDGYSSLRPGQSLAPVCVFVRLRAGLG